MEHIKIKGETNMTHIKKKTLGLLGGLALLAFFRSGALASTDTAHLQIHVTINATKSLACNTSDYVYGALAVGISSVTDTPIIVTNDSGGYLEVYKINGADALRDGGGTNWTLDQTIITTDTYRLGAQFSSAQPADVDGSWASDYLTASQQVCSATVFGNGTKDESGYQVRAVTQNTRNLWFRIHTPDQVTDAGPHTAQVTLAVQ
jgi:hypothetical protein